MKPVTWLEAYTFLVLVCVLVAVAAKWIGNAPVLCVALVLGASFTVLATLAALFKV